MKSRTTSFFSNATQEAAVDVDETTLELAGLQKVIDELDAAIEADESRHAKLQENDGFSMTGMAQPYASLLFILELPFILLFMAIFWEVWDGVMGVHHWHWIFKSIIIFVNFSLSLGIVDYFPKRVVLRKVQARLDDKRKAFNSAMSNTLSALDSVVLPEFHKISLGDVEKYHKESSARLMKLDLIKGYIDSLVKRGEFELITFTELGSGEDKKKGNENQPKKVLYKSKAVSAVVDDDSTVHNELVVD